MDTMHPLMAQALAPFAPQQSEVHKIAAMNGHPLNDDDLYVWDLHSKQVTQRISSSMAYDCFSGSKGWFVLPGHALVTGMQLKGML
jgi:hypothetical protein